MMKKLAVALMPFIITSCVVTDLSGSKINTDDKTKDASASPSPVKLKDVNAKKVQITAGTDIVVSEGEKMPAITATVTYEDNSIDSAVKWSSSDGTVATVNPESGAISGVKEGTTTIIATSLKDSNQRASIRVTVKKAVVDALKTSIFLAGKKVTEVSLKVDETQTLQATIKLSDGTDSPNVTWTSSDSTVVNVRNGNLTALKKGVATITAAAKEDSTKQASVRVTVTEEGEAAPATPAATTAPATPASPAASTAPATAK